MNSKSTKTLEIEISRDHIVSQVAALLYALNIVPDTMDVLDIRFYEPKDGIVPLEIDITRNREVKLKPRKNGKEETKLP